MKFLHPSFLLVLLILLGCGQPNSQDNWTTDEEVAEATNDQESEQEQPLGDELLGDREREDIRSIVDLFREKNVAKIADRIDFPLYRQDPIPPVKEEEFKQRFSEVFDEVLIERIATSSIDQWSKMAWRGCMLDDGAVWIDPTGNITAVNYQSDFERELRKDLIAEHEGPLPPSLKRIVSPTYRIKTQDYVIRIDKRADRTYRYTSWKRSEKEPFKAELMLDGGEAHQGSRGSQVITFTNDNYTYRIHCYAIGTPDTPNAILEIEKDGQILLTQDGSFYH
ncbi:MAG: hypothetical protein AAFZ63_08610 [Bacteroidota bacterium]